MPGDVGALQALVTELRGDHRATKPDLTNV